MDHTCLNKKSNIWALNCNTVPFSSFAFCRWCRTSWNMSGSSSKSYRRCWVVICEPCRPVTSKCNDRTIELDALKMSVKMIILCTFFFFFLKRLINHITILIPVYAQKTKNNLCLFRLSSSDSGTLCGNLEEILTFQQGLCVALEECTKYVTHTT